MDPVLLELAKSAGEIGGFIAAKPLFERLLGPSLDYMGAAMAALLERYGNKNVAEIFQGWWAKTPEADRSNHIHPQVLRVAIEEGAFADSLVSQEYFAGILASSMAPGAGDAAAGLLNTIRNLTAEQLRLHHLIYSLFRQRRESHFGSFDEERLETHGVFIPDEVLRRNAISTTSSGKVLALAQLRQHGLIRKAIRQIVALAPVSLERHDGIYIEPAALGAQLFLWIHGNPNSPAEDLFSVGTMLNDWSPSPEDWSLTRREIERQRNMHNLASMYADAKPEAARNAAKSVLQSPDFLPPSSAALREKLAAHPEQASDAEVLSALREIVKFMDGVALPAQMHSH